MAKEVFEPWKIDVFRIDSFKLVLLYISFLITMFILGSQYRSFKTGCSSEQSKGA
jgi:hypothetical protein